MIKVAPYQKIALVQSKNAFKNKIRKKDSSHDTYFWILFIVVSKNRKKKRIVRNVDLFRFVYFQRFGEMNKGKC